MTSTTKTKTNPTWTQALRNATGVIATSPAASADLRSRAQEIYNGAKVGAQLSDMNVEFIAAMRSRFKFSYSAGPESPGALFDRLWGEAWNAANPPPPATFAAVQDNGDVMIIKRDGFTLEARIHRDDDPTPPWKKEDGHGQVSDWLTVEPGYGWLLLSSNGHASRYYNFNDAKVKAEIEGWGPGTPEDAAQADFQRLKDWCDDSWCYVGVAVTVWRNGIQLTGTYGNALWGIESDAGAYLAQVADELAGPALEEAKQALADLIEGDA